jgi:hypothetical protein
LKRTITALAVAATTSLVTTFAVAQPSTGARHHQDDVLTVAQRPALPASLPRFSVTLPDIPPGGTFGQENLLDWGGCTGGNKSPAIRWSGAPAGTLFDLASKTSSGFWHWSVWNIRPARPRCPKAPERPAIRVCPPPRCSAGPTSG